MDRNGIYELFLSVLQVHGFAAVPSGNVVRIVQTVLAKQSGNPNDFEGGLESQELVTRVIPVLNAPSDEMVKVLRPLIPQYGQIAALSQPNVLIISDHASNINRLVEVVNPQMIEEASSVSQIKILPHKEKADWTLVPKYSIGSKK